MKASDFYAVLRSFPRADDPLGFEGTWREAAVRAGFIPVYSDWESCFAITGDADVVHSDGSWDAPQRLTNSRFRHIVFAQASMRYPELSELRPVRQPEDPDCPSCGGTGLVRVGDMVYDNMICECGGLGWIPSGSKLEQI